MSERAIRFGGLKLWQKGLIIILLPLFAEIIFLFVLVGLLQQAESDIRNEYHAKSVAQETSMLGNLLIEAARQLVSSTVLHSAGQSTPLDEVLKQLRRQVETVKSIQAQDDTERDYLDKITVLADEGMLYIAHARLRINDSNDGLFSLGDRLTSSHAQSIMAELKSQIQELNEYEKTAKKIDPQTAERSRQKVVWYLFGGFTLNALLALVLGAFFYRQFVRRVDAIVDNSRRMVDFSPLSPVISGHDEIAYVDEVLHETAEKLQEASMKERALAELKQQFVAMVSHDLRTPMTSIKGILGLLGEGALGPLSDKAHTRIKQAVLSCNRLIELINGLLDMEKLESGRMELSLEEISAALLIDQAVLSVETFASNLGVTISSEETEVEFTADEARLVQVLINLLSNAAKYSERGATVTVSVVADESWAEIQVADRGRGIPDELKEAIFERFRQVDISDATKKGGTGLGLAICKSIVELHGGSIGVRNNDRDGLVQGSVFWFRIPLAQPD